MFARIFMFVLFRLYMYDMDNVYVCIVLTKWSNKNKFFFKFFFYSQVARDIVDVGAWDLLWCCHCVTVYKSTL